MNKIKSILLIDDDEVSNFLTETTIKIENVAEKIEIAWNGEEGLNRLKNIGENGDSGIPEIILLDLNMPVMDGFRFLQKFSELKIERKPKVVILTSSSNPKDIARIKKFNVLGYMVKPFSVDEFRLLMNSKN